jgi:AcrR family transcriptional regulator
MRSNIPDERYYVNEEAIIDAFFLVLKEKELDKITVADITKKAGVVRSTFYNHYENIPVLITAIEDKTIEDIFSLMETFSPKNDYDMCKAYFLTICEYTKNNPFLASLLSTPRGDAFFGKAMDMFHRYILNTTQKTTPDFHTQEEFSYMIASAIGSTIGVLHKWVQEKFRVPMEVIADILTQAFMTGVIPYFSSMHITAHQSEPLVV